MTKLNQHIEKVLMIDIPTRKIQISEDQRFILQKRLHAEAFLFQERTGVKKLRPGLVYNRGLLMIATCLEQAGFSVKYLVHPDPEDRKQIMDFAKEADAVCINAKTPMLHIAVSLCEQIKHISPATVTVLGGPHIATRAVETLEEHPAVDFTMVGQCDVSLPNLLRSIDRPDLVAGTAYRVGKNEVKMSTQPIKPVVVSELPMPSYHLLSRSPSEYAHNIKTERGCPYACNFCVERLTWNKESARTIQQVIDELEYLSNYFPPKALMHFTDSNFNLRKQRTDELVDRIKHNEKIQFVYSFDTRANLIKEDQMRRMAEAGFVNCRMGFETVRNDVLKIADKSSTFEVGVQASQLIRQASPNISIHAYILTGLPGTTKEMLGLDAIHLQNMIETDLVDTVGNNLLVPYPETPHYYAAEKMGVEILSHDWSKYDRRSYPVYRLKNLSAEEIYFGFLYQEASVTEAYLRKLDYASISNLDVKGGLDYVNSTYAMK